jgi:glycosyltransferase involved in cell wall biosynthesis
LEDIRKKIVIVLPCFVGGGAERVAVNLGNALYAKGFNVSFLVLNDNGPLVELVHKDIKVHALEVNRMRYAFILLIKKLRELNPDIIFSTLGYVNKSIILLKPFLQKKIRIIFREANLPSSNIKSSRYSILQYLGYRYLYKQADYIISTSKRMCNEFEIDFHIPSHKLKVLENPVDISYIRENAQTLQRIVGPGLRLVASGRLTRQKGFDQLINSFNRLPDDTQLLIFGDGEERITLENMIKKLGLSRRIKLMGFNSSPWGYYAAADLFVLPSRWEGMPNVALEALACGTPVIATKQAGGIAEVISNSKINSIKIVSDVEDMIKEISLYEPQAPKMLRPNLLPERYTINSVSERFISMIR